MVVPIYQMSAYISSSAISFTKFRPCCTATRIGDVWPDHTSAFHCFQMVHDIVSKSPTFSLLNKLSMMGFEKIGAQAQDTSPNVGIKNGPSTSNRPLMVSLKGMPKTRAQLTPLKDW